MVIPSETWGKSLQIKQNAKIYGGVCNLFNKHVLNDDFGKSLTGRHYFVATEINF